MKKISKRNSGFTLVEMIAVLLILALVAAAVTGGLAKARERAWRLRARDTGRQLCEAWGMYLLDEHRFPSDFTNGQKVKADKNALKHLTGDSPSGRTYFELSKKEQDDGLKDHWGNQLFFSLDADYDGVVDNPYPKAFDPELQKIKASAVAWSEGNPKHKHRDDNPIVVW